MRLKTKYEVENSNCTRPCALLHSLNQHFSQILTHRRGEGSTSQCQETHESKFDLLGHGEIHDSFVSTAAPEQGCPSGVGVGLVQALLLLTMEPPHGFSQRDHWLHSV